MFGCVRLAPEGEQRHPLLAVPGPDGIDEAAIRTPLLLEHGIEICQGLGPLAGACGGSESMAASAQPEPQEELVVALASLLAVDPTEALAALTEGWSAQPRISPDAVLRSARGDETR